MTKSPHPPLSYADTTTAVPGDWARRTAGPRPLIVKTGGDAHESGPEQWRLDPGRVSRPGDHDAEEVLAGFWPDEDEVAEDPEWYAEVLAPFGPGWPGLAPAGVLDADPDARAAEVADSLLADGHWRTWLKDPRLALVPTGRSADVPAAIGWTGPVHHERDVARLCAVLRSWEDRFGIRVVALSYDMLVVSVAAPPRTRAQAEAIAVEHYAFCPGVVQGGESLGGYAEEELLGKSIWAFWWD
ncbi:DUF4253 domain-containing protein [Streptomyces graminofaciens]|nr:DUF4253 domain-containing protein [Streptomyces graminofaciens]